MPSVRARKLSAESWRIVLRIVGIKLCFTPTLNVDGVVHHTRTKQVSYWLTGQRLWKCSVRAGTLVSAHAPVTLCAVCVLRSFSVLVVSMQPTRVTFIAMNAFLEPTVNRSYTYTHTHTHKHATVLLCAFTLLNRLLLSWFSLIVLVPLHVRTALKGRTHSPLASPSVRPVSKELTRTTFAHNTTTEH